MKERIQIKHDIAANWAKAKNFIPLPGELIIYDGVIEDGKYIEQPRLKIGDGIHKLAELPFMDTFNKVEVKSKYQYEDEEEVLKIEI
jgi:hypothetical protein